VMIRKYPQQKFGRNVVFGIKGLIAVEALLFAGSYYVWYCMNVSRDFRYRMYNNFPSILDGYYRIGEYFGDSTVRQLDYRVWGVKDNK